MALPNPAPPPKNSRFSPEIMAQLQKENSPAKVMSTQEIIKQDSEKNHLGTDWKQLYANMVKASSSNKFRVLRSGNTLFCLTIKSPGIANLYLATADDGKQLIRSVKEAIQAATKANYKEIHAVINNPMMLKIMQMSGIKFEQVPTQEFADQAQTQPAVQVVMHLG